MSDLLVSTDSGLYCPAGDFYIDPWRPVGRAVVTHAHSDHASPGSSAYLTTPDGLGVLRTRLGPDWRGSRRLPTDNRGSSTASRCRCIRLATFLDRHRFGWRGPAKSG